MGFSESRSGALSEGRAGEEYTTRAYFIGNTGGFIFPCFLFWAAYYQLGFWAGLGWL